MSDRETDEESGDTTDATIFSLFKRQKIVSEEDDLCQDTYNIDRFPKFAKPIIFNHKLYSMKHSVGKQPNTRQGTAVDQKKLKVLFRGLNCQTPEIYNDEKWASIEKKLQEVAQADHSGVACVIVVVLTHGNENELYAYDKTYETCKLWEPFTKKLASNKSLAGKPKLFIIQACRGSDIDDAQDVPDAKSYIPEPEPFEPILKKIPRCADFFIAHSSFLGYMSVRNTLNGSWFIQTTCRAIEKYKHRLDLQSIMTIVRHNIAYNKTPAAKELWSNVDKSEIPGHGLDSTDSLKKKLVEAPHPTQKVRDHLLHQIRPFQGNEWIWLLAAVATIFIAWLLKADVQCHCMCGER